MTSMPYKSVSPERILTPTSKKTNMMAASYRQKQLATIDGSDLIDKHHVLYALG